MSLTTAQEVLAELAARGTEQTRKTYARHGCTGPRFGVLYSELGKLTKKLRGRQDLALELWADPGKYREARVLAAMIADPAQMTVDQLEQWVTDVDDSMLMIALSDLATKCACAPDLATRWTASPEEWRGATGFNLVANLAKEGVPVPGGEAFYAPFLELIAREIHARPNRTRYSMNSALIAIASFQPGLRERGLEIAAEIGKVEIDHGDTSCKTPNATAYIKKTVAHYAKKQ